LIVAVSETHGRHLNSKSLTSGAALVSPHAATFPKLKPNLSKAKFNKPSSMRNRIHILVSGTF